jgi:hypothetical protein
MSNLLSFHDLGVAFRIIDTSAYGGNQAFVQRPLFATA